MSPACSDLDQVADVTPSSDGCEDCLRIGATTCHVACAVARTATTAPPRRVELRAEEKGWALAPIKVDVRYDLADDGLASIDRTITVPNGSPADQRDRLADVAERTPVTLVLRAGTPITTTLRTIEVPLPTAQPAS